MSMPLEGTKVALLVEQDYQDLEVWYPLLRLREEGAEVVVVGTGAGNYKGKNGYPITVDTSIDKVRASEFSGVIVPGGWAPDFLRRHRAVLDFVRELDAAGKLVGAICHAGWVLASAGILRGRTVTFFHAIRDDVVHAGATFVDQEVARDRNLVTSRQPSDLPAFARACIAVLREQRK